MYWFLSNCFRLVLELVSFFSSAFFYIQALDLAVAYAGSIIRRSLYHRSCMIPIPSTNFLFKLFIYSSIGNENPFFSEFIAVSMSSVRQMAPLVATRSWWHSSGWKTKLILTKIVIWRYLFENYKGKRIYDNR